MRPKPMVEIGGMPIMWHVMKIYAAAGITDFVIAAGYKGDVIKEWFANYHMHMSDITFDLTTNEMTTHASTVEPWRVTIVETGDGTMSGGRLKRVRRYLGDETFCMTYGDCVARLDVAAVVGYHREHGGLATVTAIQPPGRFGALGLAGDSVETFFEKPRGDGGWVNGGFFVLEPGVLDYIEGDDTPWERAPHGGARPRREARRLPPLRLLAEPRHAARQDGARGGVGDGERALEDLVAAPACRLCAAELRLTFADLGRVAARERAARAGRPRPRRGLLPAARLRLRALPARAAPGLGGAGADLLATTRTSRPSPTAGSSTRAATSTRSSSASGSTSAASCSRSRATTATCSSSSRRAGFRRSASSRPPTSPQAARRAWDRDRRRAFFDDRLAAELRRERGAADLVVGNNVLAHVPDVHGFVEGLRIVLAPGGVVTIEFPHLLRLIEERQFDTIYHEHFSYFSLLHVERLLRRARARRLRRRRAADARRLAADLRRARTGARSRPAVAALRERERAAGSAGSSAYLAFDAAVRAAKRDLLEFLIGAKREGDVDRRVRRRREGRHAAQHLRDRDGRPRLRRRPQPAQAGALPPRLAACRSTRRSACDETRPDLLLILPWNLRDEIVAQMAWRARVRLPLRDPDPARRGARLAG